MDHGAQVARDAGPEGGQVAQDAAQAARGEAQVARVGGRGRDSGVRIGRGRIVPPGIERGAMTGPGPTARARLSGSSAIVRDLNNVPTGSAPSATGRAVTIGLAALTGRSAKIVRVVMTGRGRTAHPGRRAPTVVPPGRPFDLVPRQIETRW